MNILMVSHSVSYSGANRSFFSVINGLSAYHHIEILANNKNGEFVEKCESIGVKVHICKYDWLYAHSRNSFIKQTGRYLIDLSHYISSNISKSLLNELRESKIDLVYTNTSTVDIGVRIAKKLSIPHIWHIREFGKEDFGFIPLVSKKRLKAYYDYTDSFILISNALKEKYKKLVGNEKLKIVYNGFEISEMYYDGTHNHNGESFNILVTGVVSKGKGQSQAIYAVDALIKSGKKIELYLAGAVDKAFLSNVLEGIEDYSSWLHVLGPVKDMYNLRKKMDCELVCSLSEAFGRVTIEAMLHGLPVIGSDTGCTKELIVHNDTGLLFRNGDIYDLTQKIEILIENRDIIKRLSVNGRKYAKEFTIEKTISKIGEILRQYESQE